MLTNLKEIDQDFLRETISGEHFAEYFYPACKDPAIAEYSARAVRVSRPAAERRNASEVASPPF
jgi:hypothetical protein